MLVMEAMEASRCRGLDWYEIDDETDDESA
jgi:hypothetical protein